MIRTERGRRVGRAKVAHEGTGEKKKNKGARYLKRREGDEWFGTIWEGDGVCW